MGKRVENVQKNSLKPNAASHNNASWHTDTDGILEHSPKGASLGCKGTVPQKLSPVFWVPAAGNIVFARGLITHAPLGSPLQWDFE